MKTDQVRCDRCFGGSTQIQLRSVPVQLNAAPGQVATTGAGRPRGRGPFVTSGWKRTASGRTGDEISVLEFAATEYGRKGKVIASVAEKAVEEKAGERP